MPLSRYTVSRRTLIACCVPYYELDRRDVSNCWPELRASKTRVFQFKLLIFKSCNLFTFGKQHDSVQYKLFIFSNNCELLLLNSKSLVWLQRIFLMVLAGTEILLAMKWILVCLNDNNIILPGPSPFNPSRFCRTDSATRNRKVGHTAVSFYRFYLQLGGNAFCRACALLTPLGNSCALSTGLRSAPHKSQHFNCVRLYIMVMWKYF